MLPRHGKSHLSRLGSAAGNPRPPSLAALVEQAQQLEQTQAWQPAEELHQHPRLSRLPFSPWTQKPRRRSLQLQTLLQQQRMQVRQAPAAACALQHRYERHLVRAPGTPAPAPPTAARAARDRGQAGGGGRPSLAHAGQPAVPLASPPSGGTEQTGLRRLGLMVPREYRPGRWRRRRVQWHSLHLQRRRR